MGNSLGYIEVVGMLGAIEACDTAVKAANVELIGCELTKGGGMVTIILKGNVGAVKAAVDAAVASVERITLVVSHTVIARPSKELSKIILDQPFGTKKKEIKKEIKEIEKEIKEIKETIKEKLPIEDKKILKVDSLPLEIPVNKKVVEEKLLEQKKMEEKPLEQTKIEEKTVKKEKTEEKPLKKKNEITSKSPHKKMKATEKTGTSIKTKKNKK